MKEGRGRGRRDTETERASPDYMDPVPGYSYA